MSLIIYSLCIIIIIMWSKTNVHSFVSNFFRYKYFSIIPRFIKNTFGRFVFCPTLFVKTVHWLVLRTFSSWKSRLPTSYPLTIMENVETQKKTIICDPNETTRTQQSRSCSPPILLRNGAKNCESAQIIIQTKQLVSAQHTGTRSHHDRCTRHEYPTQPGGGAGWLTVVPRLMCGGTAHRISSPSSPPTSWYHEGKEDMTVSRDQSGPW